jgi:ATP-dependent DNA helicase RecQ
MCGLEDRKIQDYFIDTAFPSKEESESVLGYIYRNNEEGSSLGQINSQVNCTSARIGKALMFLENEGFIYKEKSRYYVSLKSFIYNEAHYSAITELRRKEQDLMNELLTTAKCYSRFIVNCLDDTSADICGICSNCLGYDEFPTDTSPESLEAAQHYFERLIMPIEPRKQWATTTYTKQTRITHQNETGICLSKYGDPGYGTLVRDDKYSSKDRFREELIGKSASVLKDFIAENNIGAITCVPSLRGNIVKDFAERLARRLGIRFIELLRKSEAKQQKFMQNSSHQCENALKSFAVLEDVPLPENVLLIDDVVDSRWTLTVCGYKLMEAGCKKVFPFALADSSQTED